MQNETRVETEINQIKGELERFEKALQEVLQVFCSFFDSTGRQWPYTLRTKVGCAQSAAYSYSTNAMIAVVIGHVLGFSNPRLLTVPNVRSLESFTLEKRFRENLLNAFLQAGKTLVNEKLPAKFKDIADSNEWPSTWPTDRTELFTYSGTFGLNDPFTLSWIYDLAEQLKVADSEEFKELLEDSRLGFWGRLKKALDLREPQFPRHPLSTKMEGISLDHAFPWMRWARLLTAYRKNLQVTLAIIGLTFPCKLLVSLELERADKWQAKLLSHLEAMLHRHLSYATIPDSEYDPPEMILALEGVLVLNPDYDRAVIERVFTTLAQPDMSRLFWRAHRPMIAQPQGLVLPPISTEIGNSLLRICGLTESTFSGDLFALCQSPLRRFAAWLLSRRVQGSTNSFTGAEAKFTGWHSDHILAADTMHLWMTANTALFLHDYMAFLRRHVRRIGKFNVVSNDECRKEAKDEKDCQPALMNREPLTRLEPDCVYRVTDRLVKNFIEPWTKRKPKFFSMLLYGPPGTGKTSIAKLLACSLGWELVQLSPSDFVRGGEAEIEEHAKFIFHALEQMSAAVVLFDEIDRLLLDRDASAYNTQADVFQFMTPGMLTKINDLASKKRLIFIISTNYAERIDGAIKRHGRIDQQYLWLPPDGRRRGHIFAKLLAKSIKDFPPADLDANLKDEDKLSEVCNVVETKAIAYFSNACDAAQELIGKTTFWIFKELEKLFENASWNELYRDKIWCTASVEKLRVGDERQFKEVATLLVDNTSRITPVIRLSNYKSRFRSMSRSQGHKKFLYADEPYEEFLLLLYDAFASGYKFTKQEEIDLLKPFCKTLTEQDMRRVIDDDIRKELKGKLKKFGYKG